MRFIKYSIAVLIITSFASCLKPKNDFAGLRTDNGTILTSITEAQFINTDAQNIGYGFSIFANFSFASPTTEDIRFFSLHVAQPREQKLSGPLIVKVAMSPLTGFAAFPAGAITIPAEISVPAFSTVSTDFPVKFTINKTGLDATKHYGATFTITSVSQGVYSELDKSVQVIINDDPMYNTSRFTGRYKWTSTIVDPANQYTITNNTKPVTLEENATNRLDIFDFVAYALSAATTYRNLFAFNTSTGASTALFAPRYVLDASGKVTSILNQSATTSVTNIALDPSGANQFTYTSNDTRTLVVKYSFTLTTTISGVSTPRTVAVTETFTYDTLQAFY